MEYNKGDYVRVASPTCFAYNGLVGVVLETFNESFSRFVKIKIISEPDQELIETGWFPTSLIHLTDEEAVTYML